MRRDHRRLSSGAATILGGLLLASGARAQVAPPCDDLPDEAGADTIPKLYIENGDTQEPLVQRLGRKLMAAADDKLRIIYRNRPTCLLRDDLFSSTKMIAVTDGAQVRTVKYVPVDPNAPIVECAVPSVASDPAAREIELGIGATFLSSCDDTAAPPGVTVASGPVQAYGFVANPLSSEVAITAEEGYLAFGFPDGEGDAKPWTVQNLRFKRGNTASTTLVMSAAIGLLPSDMNAESPDSSTSDILAGKVIASRSNPNAALGILGTELYDAKYRENGQLKLLAFKGFGQRYAYFPDSKSTTFDKQNVRDGHYLPWAPTPYIFKTEPAGSNARRLFELVMGTRAVADVDGLEAVIASGLVPECAMKVMRDSEGGDLRLFRDPKTCHCYFERSVTNGSTPAGTCAPCSSDDGPCGGGKCNFGFCEAP